VDEPVAETDGWEAGHIEVSPAAKTFLLLDQLQTFRTEFHSLLLSNNPGYDASKTRELIRKTNSN
jgi:hypothetical protein